MTKLSMVFLLFLVTTASSWATCNPDEKKHEALNVEVKDKYGQDFARTDKIVSLEEAMKDYSNYSGQEVQLLAEVTKVCQTKGCWMALKSDADEGVRVRFKDYGFFVPVSLIGKEVVVQGALVRTKVSEKLARHFKEDEGASADEIAAIKGSVYEYTFTASGVQVL
jgi:hypothetical protein